jgi:uncharacterized protein YfaQ (DUF2300 family)
MWASKVIGFVSTFLSYLTDLLPTPVDEGQCVYVHFTAHRKVWLQTGAA